MILTEDFALGFKKHKALEKLSSALEINKRGGGFLWREEFFKIGNRDFTFIREMRLLNS